MYKMIESVSISKFRSHLADFIEKLRTRSDYRLQLLDRKRPLVTVVRAEGEPRKKKVNVGAILLKVARRAAKLKPKDPSSDISSHVDRYLYDR